LRLFVPRRPGWIERRLQRLWRHFVPAPRARAVRVEIRVAPGTAPQTLIDGTSIEGEEKQDGYGQDREAAEGGSSGLL